MSKRFILSSIIFLLVSSLVILVLYKKEVPSSPKAYTHSYGDMNSSKKVQLKDGCLLADSCGYECKNPEDSGFTLGEGCTRGYLYYGKNYCEKNSAGKCVLKVSFRTKLAKWWYKLRY